jgi:hypothetical protein
MKIELNAIPLDNGEDSEGRSVKNIRTEDMRNVEAYDSPGAQGSSYHDMGRSAVKVAFEGTMTGEAARTVLEGIWSCFKKGDPVEFSSDISGAADITKVLIDSFVVTSAAGDRRRYDYSIELWEYKEPPEEPEGPATGSDTGGDEEAEKKNDEAAEAWAEEAAEGSEAGLNELKGVVLDIEGKPAKGVTVVITGGGREIEVKTDDAGAYTAEDLEPGDYSISVKETGYEDIEEKVSIGGGAGDESGA